MFISKLLTLVLERCWKGVMSVGEAGLNQVMKLWVELHYKY